MSPRVDQLPLVVTSSETVPLRSARISTCGRYRYRLVEPSYDGKMLGFVMLNPSTADEMVDDPTIRKCRGFARHNGFGGFYVCNLFALRSTNPKALLDADDIIGPHNDDAIEQLCIAQARGDVGPIVCAWGKWGAHPKLRHCAETVRGWFDHAELVCLGRNKDGTPRHPLMLPYSTPMEAFR